MLLMGIGRVEHYIETALDHSAAPALPSKGFSDDEDLQIRIGIMCVKGSELARRAHPNDENVGLYGIHGLIFKVPLAANALLGSKIVFSE